DMIDGRIARATNKGDRRRKLFGIQIDSLCDMVSFGVAPGIIAYAFGFCDVFDTIIYIFFACCGAIRLAYFNTQALTEAADLNMKSFTGMPIPSICFVLPPLALLTIFVTPDIMHWLFKAAYLVVGTAFIANFKMKKPGLKTSLISAAVMIACLIALLCFGKMQLLA
ncbi:MAG: CDP-diacylglycerol--serine O-phosphatidyltransferase, partial [Clostridia bacterium]